MQYGDIAGLSGIVMRYPLRRLELIRPARDHGETGLGKFDALGAEAFAQQRRSDIEERVDVILRLSICRCNQAAQPRVIRAGLGVERRQRCSDIDAAAGVGERVVDDDDAVFAHAYFIAHHARGAGTREFGAGVGHDRRKCSHGWAPMDMIRTAPAERDLCPCPYRLRRDPKTVRLSAGTCPGQHGPDTASPGI